MKKGFRKKVFTNQRFVHQRYQKGISPVLSHSVFMAVGVVLLIFLSALVWFIYTESIKQAIKTELILISQTLANKIIELYSLKDSPVKPLERQSILLGEVNINLPEKVSGSHYAIELIGPCDIYITDLSESNTSSCLPKIIMNSYQPKIQTNYTLPIEIGMQGYADSGIQPITIRYYRLSINNTIKDKITLGKEDILIELG